MTYFQRLALAGFVALGLSVQGKAAHPLSTDWVLNVMRQELERNRQRLRLEGYDPPYLIMYSVRDLERYYISGRVGAIFQTSTSQSRFVNVDVRVGDYSLDSSEDEESLFALPSRYVPTNQGPIEKSEEALRRVLWLLTDYKYKAALVSYLKVKGKLVHEAGQRKVGSMTKEEAVVVIENKPPFTFDVKTWQHLVRRLSAIFLEYPEIFDSSVEVSAARLTRYVVTTEGTVVKTVDDYVTLAAAAMVRADDGQLLDDAVYHYGRSPDDLPSPHKLEEEVREMAKRLCELRKAPVLDPTTVPVLMSPEATGVFFHETIGHRLEGQRLEDKEEGRTFKGHLGKKILPDFITIYDDPTLEKWNGIPLNGHYRVDDEGVRASKAVLIEGGVLVGLLMSRRPVEGFERSNGHGRSDGFQKPVGRMAVLVVEGKAPVSSKRLREMLLEEVRRQGKPYGLIIERIAGGSTNTSTYGYQAFKGIPRIAYKVDAETGQATLVRGVEIVGTPLSSIGKVLATSDVYGVFNGYCSAESGSVPVSTVAPETLFAEIELQRSQEAKERPPILPPPERGN